MARYLNLFFSSMGCLSRILSPNMTLSFDGSMIVPSLVMHLPFTKTSPFSMSWSAFLRLVSPLCARNLFSLIRLWFRLEFRLKFLRLPLFLLLVLRRFLHTMSRIRLRGSRLNVCSLSLVL